MNHFICRANQGSPQLQLYQPYIRNKFKLPRKKLHLPFFDKIWRRPLIIFGWRPAKYPIAYLTPHLTTDWSIQESNKLYNVFYSHTWCHLWDKMLAGRKRYLQCGKTHQSCIEWIYWMDGGFSFPSCCTHYSFQPLMTYCMSQEYKSAPPPVQGCGD